jgi:hypothetical protein
MKIRTQTEVERQVQGLLAEKKTLPIFSAFGDPNHESIDAQIQVLRGNEDAELYSHTEDYHEYIYQQAIQAESWLNGDNDDDLFSEE